MASKPCDDPMDLGPFLQNYVLRNPFQEFMLGSGQLPDGQPKAKDRAKKVAVGCSVEGSQSAVDMAMPHVPSRLKRSTRQDENDSADGSGQSKPFERTRRLFVTSIESSQSLLDLAAPGLTEVTDRVIKQEVDATEGVDSVTVAIGNSGVGGILSKYSEVHQWLLSNFKYLSKHHNCLTSARILLGKVQRTFPSVRKKALGQLIAVTYPCCPKIVQDGETFFQGLVPKLAENILENASQNFMTALENVTKGQMTIHEAAEKFDVYEAALKSVLMWDKVDLAMLPCNGVPSLNIQSISSRTNGTVHANKTNSKELLSKESRMQKMLTRPNERLSVTKRARLAIAANDAPPAESNDDSIDFETMLQNIQGESIVRKAAARTSSKEVDRLHLPTDASQTLSIKEELPEDGTDSQAEERRSRRAGASLNCSASGSSGSLASHNPSVVTVEDRQLVGSEPPNDGKGSSNGILQGSVAKSGASPSTKFVRQTRLQELRRKKVVESASSGCDTVSDLELRFQRTQQDLASCQSVNLRLKSELESIQSENLLLKEELNTRDFHLVHLAEDFFKLHSQFKQLAEQFQLILNETQNSLSQSFSGQNSR